MRIAHNITAMNSMRQLNITSKLKGKNVQGGISLCRVSDGALYEVDDKLYWISELSIMSANDFMCPYLLWGLVYTRRF